MIYQTLGRRIAQEEIFRVISEPDHQGRRFCKTYRMVLDAQQRGFAAIAFRARDPIRATAGVLAVDAYPIMNHRVSETSGLGHYTVAVGIDSAQVAFHDPEVGPVQRRTIESLRDLWQARFNPCEIAGNLLIAVAGPSAAHLCMQCGTSVPAELQCGYCKRAIPLTPAAALGCMTAGCAARVWESLLCPYCDRLNSGR